MSKTADYQQKQHPHNSLKVYDTVKTNSRLI